MDPTQLEGEGSVSELLRRGEVEVPRGGGEAEAVGAVSGEGGEDDDGGWAILPDNSGREASPPSITFPEGLSSCLLPIPNLFFPFLIFTAPRHYGVHPE